MIVRRQLVFTITLDLHTMLVLSSPLLCIPRAAYIVYTERLLSSLL